MMALERLARRVLGLVDDATELVEAVVAWTLVGAGALAVIQIITLALWYLFDPAGAQQLLGVFASRMGHQ